MTSQILAGQYGENQIYYQNTINGAINQVLTIFQQSGADQGVLNSLSSNLPASMVVQQITQTVATGGKNNLHGGGATR